MMTKKFNYITPAMRIISLDTEESILSMSGEGNANTIPSSNSNVGASLWIDGNNGWLSSKKDEESIWK